MQKPILLLICVVSLTGCQAAHVVAIDLLASSTPANKAYRERLAQNAVWFMSLETMFPDERARALARAAGRGRVGAIDRLVAEGVDVNVRGHRNCTPLAWAMKRHNLKGFKRLLELGADPNLVFDDGQAVLHWTVKALNDRFLKLALEHDGDPNLIAGVKKETPLHRVMRSMEFMGKEKILILLDAGADMDSQNMFGQTPMIDAAILSRFDVVYEFLERGADYRIRSRTLGESDLADWIAFLKTTPPYAHPESELSRSMQKVIDWLAVRGVEIPLWIAPLERCRQKIEPIPKNCHLFE